MGICLSKHLQGWGRKILMTGQFGCIARWFQRSRMKYLPVCLQKRAHTLQQFSVLVSFLLLFSYPFLFTLYALACALPFQQFMSLSRRICRYNSSFVQKQALRDPAFIDARAVHCAFSLSFYSYQLPKHILKVICLSNAISTFLFNSLLFNILFLLLGILWQQPLHFHFIKEIDSLIRKPFSVYSFGMVGILALTERFFVTHYIFQNNSLCVIHLCLQMYIYSFVDRYPHLELNKHFLITW